MYKILCLEDDKISAFIMEKLLQKEFDVQIFERCTDIYRVIETQVFDILILEINLIRHSVNGVDVMKVIRKIPHQTNARIIATTAYATRDDQRYYLKSGFDTYISKPVTRNILTEKIYNLLA